MKDDALKLDPIFKNFYIKKLKEKCNDFKLYGDIGEIIKLEKQINEDSYEKKIMAENISVNICIGIFIIFFIVNCYVFNIFHFNFIDIMCCLLNAVLSFFLISFLSFFIFPELQSFFQAVININKKPKEISFRVFYSFFHFGIKRYINKIAKKTVVNSDIFYELIEKSYYNESEKKQAKEKYSNYDLDKEISLALFSKIIAKVTIDYEYGEILSNFYS